MYSTHKYQRRREEHERIYKLYNKNFIALQLNIDGWLVVFNVPSTARSFRDGTPIYNPLRRT